ncbi:MAG: response regulator [Patescibacteria group bacterium]|nr:response regulator [Patescibacteria group bacterium]
MNNILIVEDDKMLVEIYHKKFSSDGYQVDTAGSGVEAIKKIIKNKPDLVLLDLVMPEEDGFEVLRRVKNNAKSKDVRIIVFSNLSQEEDKEKATALGAEGFITKSDFTPQEIVEKVHEILKIDKSEN